MSNLVIHGAQIRCTQGSSPASLSVLPVCGTCGLEKPAATVMDFAPMVNVAPFGMCRSPANPQVAAATAAAMGTLTPQPCVPVTVAPWSPGSSAVTISGLSALTDDSTCNCAWAGTVSVSDPGSDALVIE